MRRNIFVTTILVFVMVITPFLTCQAEKQGGAEPEQSFAPRQVPARLIPVPSEVSPELKAAIARPLNPELRTSPKTTEQWRALVAMKAQQDKPVLAKMLKLFPVNIKSETQAGVKTYLLTPESILDKNQNRILMHLHGGGYVFNGGESALGEAILMAFHGKIPVISVDYRMAPDFPFPAALDDSVTVYKEILKKYKPKQIGIFGTSTGGGLTAATIFKLRELGLPLPGAVGLGTPWADLTRTSDTLYTNEDIDDVIVTYDGMIKACAKLYAGSHDMKDPLISPVYGDFTKGFPPAILTSGTRDLLLSDTVRVHRKLREAGIDAFLQVFEGLSHAQYISLFTSPESREAFQEIALFFQNHLDQ